MGKPKSSRGDYTASEDDNVLVQGVEGNKYSLGYIPYAYFAPHSSRMKAVAIQWDKNKVKEPVMPSPENVIAGTYNPLSRPLFIYVNRKSLDKPAVKEFVELLSEKCWHPGERGQVCASRRNCVPDGGGSPSHDEDRNRFWRSSRSRLVC